jgi:hypothetical protein
MSEKRTKADKGQREADQLEKKSSHRPPQNQGKKAREDLAKPLCGRPKQFSNRPDVIS